MKKREVEVRRSSTRIYPLLLAPPPPLPPRFVSAFRCALQPEVCRLLPSAREFSF